MSPNTLFLLFCVLVYNSYEITQNKTYQINDDNCGQIYRNKTENFIIGGSDSGHKDYPFMVFVQSSKNWCTGTLISSRYVMTASHCIKSTTPEDYYLYIGEHDINYFYQNNTSNEYKADQIIMNGCFNKKAFQDSDIALLRLQNGIQMNEFIKTICLPPENTEPINAKIYIAGWGISNYIKDKDGILKPESPYILQVTESKLYPELFCNYYTYFTFMGLHAVRHLGNKICLMSEVSTTCFGDSGGPAFQEVNGKWYQIGISSYITNTISEAFFPFIGIKYEKICQINDPNIFTKTSKYRNWIQKSIERYIDSTEKIITTKC